MAFGAKRTWCAWLAAALAAAGPAWAGPPPEAVEKARQATVVVEALGERGTAYGSGFCVEETGLFLTKLNAVEGATGSIKLVLRPGTGGQSVVEAAVIRKDRALDLALLRAKGGGPFVSLVIGPAETPRPGATLTAVGCPLGQAGAGYRAAGAWGGKVTAIVEGESRRRWLQVESPAEAGASGGPVLDEQGRVAGVIGAGIGGTTATYVQGVETIVGFLARPDIVLEAPRIPMERRYEPATFRARAVQYARLSRPLELELTLSAGAGDSRRVKLAWDGTAYVGTGAAWVRPLERGYVEYVLTARYEGQVVHEEEGGVYAQMPEDPSQGPPREAMERQGGQEVTRGYRIEAYVTGLKNPQALAFSPGGEFGHKGELFVGDARPDPGTIYRVPGKGTRTVFSQAADNLITHLAFPPRGSEFGPVLYAIHYNTIWRFDKTGSRVWGIGLNPFTWDFAFAPPGAFGPSLFYLDSHYETGDQEAVRRLTPGGAALTPLVTKLPEETTGLAFGPGGAFGSDLYLVRSGTARAKSAAGIIRVGPDGKAADFVFSPKFGTPVQLAFDPHGLFRGNLYVTDIRHDAILEVAPDGQVRVFARGFGFSKTPDEFKAGTADLAFGPDGALYVADSGSGTVWRIWRDLDRK